MRAVGENAKRVFFEDQVFYVLPEVYEPAEDTFLLAENLEAKPDGKVLDIGTGSGILAVLSALKGAQVVAVDINPRAVRCAKLNAEVNDVSEKVDIVCGDLFGPLTREGLFDVVLFNAPYLPTEDDEPEDWLNYAWTGGRTGRQIIDRFIEHVPGYLTGGGRVLLVQSTLSDVSRTIKELAERGFKTRIRGECKAAFETITLVEAAKIAR